MLKCKGCFFLFYSFLRKSARRKILIINARNEVEMNIHIMDICKICVYLDVYIPKQHIKDVGLME